MFMEKEKWIKLIKQARNQNLSINEIRQFLNSKKGNTKNAKN